MLELMLAMVVLILWMLVLMRDECTEIELLLMLMLLVLMLIDVLCTAIELLLVLIPKE